MQEVLGRFVAKEIKPPATVKANKEFALNTLRSLHDAGSLNDVEKHALKEAIEALAV